MHRLIGCPQRRQHRSEPNQGDTGMKHYGLTLAMLAGLAAGCTTESGPPRYASTTPPSRVAGQWLATDGVAVSNFAGGRFSTTLQATGETVTEGTYVETGDKVALDFYSVRQQRQSKASCNFADGGRLECVNDSGAQFALVRRTTS